MTFLNVYTVYLDVCSSALINKLILLLAYFNAGNINECLACMQFILRRKPSQLDMFHSYEMVLMRERIWLDDTAEAQFRHHTRQLLTPSGSSSSRMGQLRDPASGHSGKLVSWFSKYTVFFYIFQLLVAYRVVIKCEKNQQSDGTRCLGQTCQPWHGHT